MVKSIPDYIKTLRPHQWVKNLLILFPAFFAGKIADPSVRTVAIRALVSFSLAASCGYVLNDIYDRPFDRQHSKKKYRPIAYGRIPILHASLLIAILYLAAMLTAMTVSMRFEGYLILYLLISVLYTVRLKQIVIVDIFMVSLGFLVRVLAGGVAFTIVVTNWLFVTVFIVSLLLAAGKRLSELVREESQPESCRQSLNDYSCAYLEGILWSSSAVALVTYTLYVIENNDALLYTVPMAAYGLFRYIYVAKAGKGDPTDALLKDKHILLTGLAWASLVGLIIYQ